MATIPIEVIVQDAESPVIPTPVDPTNSGDNTNITVPDTGAGTVDSNNSGINNSSAAISIVSIVIALLAIGAVVTLLVRKYNKRKKANIEAGNNTRQEKRAMAVTSTIAVLALTVLLGQLVVAGVVSPIATNAATDDTANDETNHIDVADKISIVVERTEDSEETITKVTNTSYVTSTADFGYKVTAAMTDNATIANLYLDGDETSEYYIAPVSDEEDETLTANTWGYTLSEEETYLPVPLVDNAAVVLQGDTKVEDEEMTIYYGVNVNKELPAGTYEGTIEYTLEPTPGFPDTLVYMQDMTPEICANAPTPGNKTTDPVPTATLIDKRDNKTYTIAKLADGNCWMTQNLDLDLSTEITLTPEDTNISSDWTPMRSTISFTGTSVSGWSNAETTPDSADPGDVYYYTSGTNDNDIQYNSLVECEAAGHIDCLHYHAGNYYNWSAAVASNDTSSMTEQFSNTEGSICPAGWRLPTGPDINNIDYSDMGSLATNYSGILEDVINEGCGRSCNYYNYLDGGFNKIRTAPLWLARSGNVDDNALWDIGGVGGYWSNTIRNGDESYYFRFSSNNVVPANFSSKYYGHSIRCLAE